MNVKIKAFGPFPIMRVMQMLENGQIDVIPNMTKIPLRESKFIFPPTPLAEITACVVVLKDNPLKTISEQKDFYNLRIGFIDGGYIPPLLRHEKIKFHLVPMLDFDQRLIEMLEARRIDAFLHINYLALKYELKLMGKSSTFRIIMLPVEKPKVYCVFQKSERGRRLAEKFEKINAPLYKAGVYNKMAEKLVE